MKGQAETPDLFLYIRTPVLKPLLKKYLLYFKVRNRFGPEVQIAQRALYLKYKRLPLSELPLLTETGFRVFSQFEEDGILLYLFSRLGMENRTFLEIGSDDGINSNSANLYFNFGWQGVFMDANKKSINRGKYFFSKYPHSWMYPPKFVEAKVNRENINELVSNARLSGEIGFLSIDIDGNDYWIWDALEVVSPKVVIIETNILMGKRNLVVPYDSDYVYPGKHPLYHGASPTAMVKLGKKKGYRLVGANDLGFNFLFVKNGLCEAEFPEVSIDSCLQHPSAQEGLKKFEQIAKFEFEEGK